MGKKYELIKEDDYYRPRACKDFQLITGEVVRKGDPGGLVEGEYNLSQEGNCWIGYNARAYGNSRVKDSAVLEDYSIACDNSTISDNAVMKDFSRTYDNSTLSGNAIMKDYSWARDNSTVSGNAVMKDFSGAEGDSIISGNAVVQAYQRIMYGSVTTDLLGTKDWVGALYAELGVVPNDGKVVLYHRVWSTDNPKIDVDEDALNYDGKGFLFTSLEFINCHEGNIILEYEVAVKDILTVQFSKVRARKCKILRVYKEE